MSIVVVMFSAMGLFYGIFIMNEPTQDSDSFDSSFHITLADPTLYETMISSEQAEKGIWFGWGSRENNDGDIPGWIKAFYREINKAKLNRPWVNHNLPKRKNLWNEEIQETKEGLEKKVNLNNKNIQRLKNKK